MIDVCAQANAGVKLSKVTAPDLGVGNGEVSDALMRQSPAAALMPNVHLTEWTVKIRPNL